MSIVVNGLTKVFEKQEAIKNISFEVKTGEIVGFLGPNGAGKSTTLKIITGYLSATQGNVFINDEEQNIDNSKIKKTIGYLPENNPLYLDLYILEFLTFILGIHQITKKEYKKKIEHIVQLCGLEKEIHKKIGTLSKGFRQRVGLASALIHDPNVLILDEPTTGLDPNQIIEIRQLISMVSQNKTVLFSSHILQEVEAMCDRVIILNDGKIVADNTIQELRTLKNATSYRVVFSASLDTKTLSQCTGVLSYKLYDKNSYILHTDGKKDYSAFFFDLALKNDIKLLHLTQENKSLETLFREITLEQK